MMDHSHEPERPLTDERPGAPHDPSMDRGDIEGSDLTRSDTERSPSPGQELSETGQETKETSTTVNRPARRTADKKTKARKRVRAKAKAKTKAKRKTRPSTGRGRSVARKPQRKSRSTRARAKSTANKSVSKSRRK